MNERIKELAIQAGFFYEDYKDIWYLEYHNQTCEEEMKKFAELIIQECARIAASTPCPYNDDRMIQNLGHTWDMACVSSANRIRNIMTGADIHAGDGGYSIGTEEGYKEFLAKRNASNPDLAKQLYENPNL